MPLVNTLPTLPQAEPWPAVQHSSAATQAEKRPDATPVARPVAAAEAPVPTVPNPSSRLDPSLGLVVLMFRDANGETHSIPSERELAAYRSAGGAGKAEKEPATGSTPPAEPGPAE